jgi:hypothetical protein
MRLAIEKSAKSNNNTRDASKKAHDVTGVISSPKKLIIKKSKRLGRFEKELVIRLVRMANGYHFVLARRRGKPYGRKDKLGFLANIEIKGKKYSILGLDYNKIKKALIKGARFTSVAYRHILY